jgi:hypothetical protein
VLPPELRALPYLVHTNRELGLMLEGKKPLAIFGDAYGHFPKPVLRYFRMFDRHVEAGRFLKREYVFPLNDPQGRFKGIHTVLYALPDQDWRIDALIALQDRPGQWTKSVEREFGVLLGYEDWQNDIWIARMRQNLD